MGQAQKSFDDLTVEEQIQHVQELWDRIASRPEQVPVTEAQKAELRRRLTEHRQSPENATPWQDVRDRLVKKP